MAFLKFPLFFADGQSGVELRPQAVQALQDFAEKEAAGLYRWVELQCLCGEAYRDTVLTEKDRYGLAVPSLACGRCGLVRSAKALDPASMAMFYEQDYRRIYEVDDLEAFYRGQKARGEVLVDYAQKWLPQGAFLFEVGCGAGGVLEAFRQAGYAVAGCDFDERYLEMGRGRGLDLRHGDFHQCGPGRPQAIILCHVLEHFLEPARELQGLIAALAEGGLLIIEVPGLYAIARTYPDVLSYFQSAHIYNYGRSQMLGLLQGLGLEVLAIDESCRAVARKPQGWQAKPLRALVFDDMQASARRTLRLFYWAALSYRYAVSPWVLRQYFMRLRRALGAWLRRRIKG
jgi:SAM-dependent methyltransferase